MESKEDKLNMTFKEWLLKDVCNATCRERKADEIDPSYECIECEQDKMIAWYAGRGIAIAEIEKIIKDHSWSWLGKIELPCYVAERDVLLDKIKEIKK